MDSKDSNTFPRESSGERRGHTQSYLSTFSQKNPSPLQISVNHLRLLWTDQCAVTAGNATFIDNMGLTGLERNGFHRATA